MRLRYTVPSLNWTKCGLLLEVEKNKYRYGWLWKLILVKF